MRLLIILATVAVAASLASISLAVREGLHQRQAEAAARTRENAAVCRAENGSRATLSDLLVFFETYTLENKGLTDDQRKQVTDFYRDALARLRPIACS